ncbi:MAG TPA: NAD-dependent epimerase/dehydratase family protein [Candidatus Limnocylindrales bacterium]|nr:NAD-dependent epimerase/dehydratase family protein [Candidatus Limnocylindrales bacterium]
MESGNTVLVLGASGGIGGEVARQLRNTGWQVRALKRGLGTPRVQRDGIEWVEGDALERDDVMAAAADCAVIVHAVNPPGYRRWSQLVLPMLDNTIAAASAQGATIVLPGTVYNYGPDAFPVLRETSPQHPRTRKGAIRVELERRLQAATEAGVVRAIVVRAGDFFGPRLGNSWFTQGMVKPGRPVASVSLPASPSIGHQFAFLPDVARTMVLLLARRHELPPFSSFHMAGHWDADGTQLGQAIQRVVVRRGGQMPTLKAFPWWLVRLASPFVVTFRELLELRYLWTQYVRMDNRRLIELLGVEPHTPLDDAVEQTLEGIGCLGDVSTSTAAVAADRA